ncbi:nucleotidyl transferase AbiEii/AbiGii toxin family protein [Candidatus Bipolaricaulota bacterium]|nr:nucleotidyl transferase AbiEii/AbiGii toxin family protein [Candidatus Bipolaricaulota bacterium]MBS3792518.1 nucleotidyl transferase AbiEii/AbiGii toxin family protein [Candidatus Bipolaricaulota bacterium]
MHPEALTKQGKQLLPQLSEFEDFYIAGGTGLALQIGHRISEDFDLFTESYIPDNFLEQVEDVFSDHSVSPSVNNPDELTLFVGETKVTFLRYPFPVVGKQKNYEGVSLLEAKEIAATKAYTIGRRGSYKDYVDLYFCLRGEYTTIKEIIDIASQKYGEKFNARLFLEQLVYYEDIEASEIKYLKEEVQVDELESFFGKKIREFDF